ncbi:MAG TPA: ethylbenzene dehydrogenase-related protein [Anaerolineales bacterium]|nr:ethylbenzene dehydrogenase-related protein [Anaerolineales bacterium]
MKKLMYMLSLLMMTSLALAACGGSPTPTATATEVPTDIPTEPPTVVPTEAPTEATTPTSTAPEGTLAAYSVDTVPTLDGVADDEAWANAPELTIPVTGGANNFSTDAKLKAVYSGDTVYFLLSYADPTESWLRAPWQKQDDGSWATVKDPNDKGGDNNIAYEDKFAMIWSIDNSIQGFETSGCFVACHAGENSDVKPYGNKYTNSEGELGDIWHWKSVRNDGQVDDQYLDSTRFDAQNAKEAGRKSDANDGGGYVNNATEDGTVPAFTSPAVDTTTGAPGYILDSEKMPLDQAALDSLPAGSYIPGIVKAPFSGDRGDISAAWQWADGTWTIEFSRALTTDSETDVQFDDLNATYHFGLAVFDNAQVRHAFQTGVTPFVFMQR